MQEIWSPVQVVAPEKLPHDFRGMLPVENRYDFTNLNQCSFAWQLARFSLPIEGKSGHAVMASGGNMGPNVAPHAIGEMKLRSAANLAQSRRALSHSEGSAGRELWTWSWGLNNRTNLTRSDAPGRTRPGQTSNVAGAIVIRVGPIELNFSKQTGALVEVKSKWGKCFRLVSVRALSPFGAMIGSMKTSRSKYAHTLCVT